eukprot:366408-Chlamydomonas_euryale.AAC.5
MSLLMHHTAASDRARNPNWASLFEQRSFPAAHVHTSTCMFKLGHAATATCQQHFSRPAA